ncbi:autotransporter-associated beta strand repeat-containing protein [Methylomagnum ishizawai]|uniref:Autotransporter-associated beta strand repeat-containing protein n=1 Tax=Methylomagnum ishizawai TaxID=1760988 RepID=A0A1Y6CXK8_9GAMM|nr:autotransporter-associated beta strand repeat-containing protein [Methylomagnum ishizawai]
MAGYVNRERRRGEAGYGRNGVATLCAGFSIALVHPEAGAETWIGQNNGNWYQSSNWRGGRVPGEGTDTTTVANGAAAVVNGGTAQAGGDLDITGTGSAVVVRSEGSLDFGTANVSQGGQLQALGGSATGTTLNIGGSGSIVAVDDGGSLDFVGVNVSQGGQLQVFNGKLVGDVNLDNGQLVFAPAAGNTTTYAGAIGGGDSTTNGCDNNSCASVIVESGTVLLKGQSSYSGQTDVFDGATLRLGSANALQNSAIIVRQGATLELGGTDATVAALRDLVSGGGGRVNLGASTLTLGHQDGLFSGVIVGSGGLIKAGSGTQVLAGQNTYTGPTVIEGGALVIGDGGTQGAIAGNVVDNAILAFKRSDAVTFGGNISGSGALVQAGSGVLTLTGTNSYTRGTVVEAGTLAGDTRSLQGAITNNAQVVFNQTADGSYLGDMSGTGSLVKNGAGILTLAGNNSYTGTTTVNAGVLAGNATSLQGNIRLADNTLLVFDQAQDAPDNEYDGSITGSGGMVKNGAGTLILGGLNSYTGSTTVNAGVLQGDTGSLRGNILDNATVRFDQADDGSYGGVISGGGGLLKTGGGVLTLANASTYTGTTQVDGGTLQLQGAAQYTFVGNVVNNAGFSVSQTTARYQGDFTNNGAYLSQQATSQFENLTVGGAGYLAGGSAQDQFIVAGNFLNTSTQAKQWNTANASLEFTGTQGTHHLMQLAATDKGTGSEATHKNFLWGAVKLGAGNTLELTDGNAEGKKPALYVQKLVLPGGKAQLADITSDYNIYFNSTLAANNGLQDHMAFGGGNGELLSWSFSPQLAGTPTQPDTSLTPTQQSFAQGLDQACNGAQGQLLQQCQQLQSLSPAGKQQAAQQLTPDQVASQGGVVTQIQTHQGGAALSRMDGIRHGNIDTMSFNFNGLQIGARQLAALGPLFGGGGAAGDEDAARPAGQDASFRDAPVGAFIQGQFTFGDLAENEWQRGYHFDTRNVTFGADYRLNDKLVAGAMFSYSNTNAHYNQNAGSMNSNAYLGSLYGSYYLPLDFYVDLAATYGGQDYGFTRQYSYPGFVGQARGNPGSGQFGFTLNLGKDFAYQAWSFSPYTRFEYANLHIDAYRESGGEGYAMNVGGQTAQSFVSDLGFQASHQFSTPFGIVAPALRVEWEHQFLNDNRGVQMSFVDSSQGAFVLQTGEPDRDYVNLGGSVVATLPNGGSGFLRYESRLGQSDVTQHIVQLGFRMSF